jgi:hypothetical protein
MTNAVAPLTLSGAGAVALVRRVENVRGSNALHGERNPQSRDADERRMPAHDRRLSQSGTGRRAQWDTTHLSAPFVAQVLGQLTAPAEMKSCLAFAAYRQRAARPALPLVFDESA